MSVYAFDCDGTFTRYPSLFAELGSALRAAGHRVIILTGNRRETMLMDRAVRWPLLLRAGWYDEMITWDDARPEEIELLRTTTAREAVAVFKARVCEERNIAVLFDDDAESVRYHANTPVFGVA